jgi:predicted PurR-regulated permease PerM
MWQSSRERRLHERSTTIHVAPSTIVLAVATVATAIGLILLAINLVSVLVTVFLAITLAETIRPLVESLQRRGMHRPFAILLIYLVIFGVLIGSIALIVPPLTQQVVAFARESPRQMQDLRQMVPGLNQLLLDLGLLGQVQTTVSDLAGQAPVVLRGIGLAFVQGVAGIFSLLSGFILAAFWIGLTETVDRNVVSHLPIERRLLVRSLARDLSETLGGWLRGQAILMVFVGVLSFVGLVILGVRYPVALAVFAGVTEVIPIVGPWIGAIPAVIIAGVANPVTGVLVALLYLAIQQIENNFLVPKVMQRAVGLHPFLVLVALLVGGSLLGIAGIIISVPLAAALQVTLKRLLLPTLLVPEAEVTSIEQVLAELPREKTN